MYATSSDFHTAVKNGNPQKALLIFSDCVFTDLDISVSDGIHFNEYFNTEEDLAIGQANSSEISFTLFNDNRLLNSYKFGEFLATLGVRLSADTYTQKGYVQITTGYGQYIGNLSKPYLTRDGSNIPAQPDFAVHSLLGYDGKVYAFGDSNQYKVYNDKTGADITSSVTINSFMLHKSRTQWEGKGLFYNKSTRKLFMYEGGDRQIYEFCPLGWFIAERPKAPDQIQINMTCYDRMQLFDEDMPTAAKLGVTYPTTIGNLYSKLCKYVGVTPESTTFINSTAIIRSEPDDFKTVTMRDVLKWIAEAAGSNARFNRDGVLRMEWLRNTSQAYEATGYSEFNPYWYQTKKVTKLYNRDTQDVEDHTYGSGSEGYLIQDNPLLKGVK